MTQIETKLAEVRAGRAPEYLQPLEELQINMKNRMEVSTVLRELRLSNINCKFEAEQMATEQNYESEKRLLIDSIKDDLEEKIHILEEDKSNVDFSSGLWEVNSSKSRRRKADPLDPDRRKKPVTVTGPFIVYMLAENEIIEDWTQIKKSLTQRKIHDGKLLSSMRWISRFWEKVYKKSNELNQLAVRIKMYIFNSSLSFLINAMHPFPIMQKFMQKFFHQRKLQVGIRSLIRMRGMRPEHVDKLLRLHFSSKNAMDGREEREKLF